MLLRPFAVLAAVLLIVSCALVPARYAPVQPLSRASIEEHIHLDADHMAASRHVSFEVDNKDPNVRSIELAAGIEPVKLWLTGKPGITLTFIPDRPAGSTTPLFDLSPPERPALDVTDICLPSCHHGATIVVRLDGKAPAVGVDLTLDSTLWAVGRGTDGAKLDTKLAIRNDAELAFTGNPTSRVVNIQERVHVSSAKPKAKKALEIRVAASALKAPLDYPLVVSVTMSAKSSRIEHADVPTARVILGDMEVPLHEGESMVSVDVLAMCRASHLCEIPVVVDSAYLASSTVGVPTVTGSADLTWRIEVRVEAFDGRRLPAGAVSIVDARQ